MTTLVTAAFGWVGCTAPPGPGRDDPPPFSAELAAFAAGLAGPATRADPTRSDHASPDLVWPEADGTLWLASSAAPTQWHLRWDGRAWVLDGTRLGPLRTRRCAKVGERTWCVGEREPGGVRDPADPGFRTELPLRGGFRDLAVVGDHAYVVDAVTDEVVVLDASGSVLGRAPVPAAPLRLGALGDRALWVASGTAPTLAILPLRGPWPGAPIPAALGVPLRDAAFDEATGTLWTVGPADRPVRRASGPMVGPTTALVGWDVEGLLAGTAAPVVAWEGGCVDGVRVVVTRDGPAVACAGSDEVRLGARRLPAGLAPSGLAVVNGDLVVAARDDDAVVVLGVRSGRVTLDDRPRDGLVDLGRRLTASPVLWQDTTVTCQSCHWDGLVDHRLTPGLAESRFEQTRPFVGVGALGPLFTPGQAGSVDEAVEGLLRTLDDRYYGTIDHPFWLEDKTVRTRDGLRTLTALEVRRALVAALVAWPVEAGPLNGAVPPEQRASGLAVFDRDCARCHTPTLTTRDRRRVPSVLLGERPLPLAAPVLARAGPVAFTPRGNRVPPLWMLDRGGPFLSDGSARTLDELLRRTDPAGPAVHGHRGEPVLGDEDRAALVALLLSL